MESTSIVIVGGGVAGLSAAKTLTADCDYLLIEAQNYLGGRILTVDAVPNLTIDLGAQYIHGDKKNSVYDICEELGILLSSDDEESDDEAIVVSKDGHRFDSEILDKSEDFWERARDKAEDKFEDRSASSKSISFAAFVPKDFQRRLSSSSSIPKSLIEPLTEYYCKLEMTETSCMSLDDLNLVEYINYEDLQGEYENDLKNGGYRPFINHLASFIPRDNRIRLNCEVRRVKFDEDQKKIIVETIDHQKQQTSKIICDHLIWTTSLGFLKENFHRIFAEEPQLIQQKEKAIENIGFGTVNKVFLIYKNKFWKSNVSSIVLLKTDKRPDFHFSDRLKAKLHEESVSEELLERIIDMLFHYDVLPSSSIPVLICWFVGPVAVETEKLSDQLVGAICHEVLCQCLKIDVETNRPTKIIKSSWNSNKYIRGSYCYYSVRSSKNDGKQLRAVYAPDGTPRILFAGEATHEGYYSTVNAALETGIRAAKKVLSSID